MITLPLFSTQPTLAQPQNTYKHIGNLIIIWKYNNVCYCVTMPHSVHPNLQYVMAKIYASRVTVKYKGTEYFNILIYIFTILLKDVICCLIVYFYRLHWLSLYSLAYQIMYHIIILLKLKQGYRKNEIWLIIGQDIEIIEKNGVQ